jgi:glycosyltransferase involved in cell wall biosynthesis
VSEPVTVITLTRRRPDLLARAIASVRAQDYAGPVEHLVVIDDDPDTAARLETVDDRGRVLRYHLEPRPPEERGPDADGRAYVYPRIARLLNLGVRLASSPWVAFLDDDNDYEPDHLSTLSECARRNACSAVHSVRQMVWRDGSPYLEESFPGAPNPEEGARLYRLMCERGVWVAGTNVLRDRVDSEQDGFRNSTVMDASDPVFLVDQSLWLIRRDLMLEFPIPETFSDEDVAANTCPDDKMLEVLVRAGVKIVSSGLPTLRYHVGGISNGDELPLARSSGRS